MVNGDYIRHDILFAMDILVAGIRTKNKRTMMRAALNILEMLLRNINAQMKSSQKSIEQEDEDEPAAA